MLFSDSIAQPAPGRCRFERVWDFPTSILQRKNSRCIYVCPACGYNVIDETKVVSSKTVIWLCRFPKNSNIEVLTGAKRFIFLTPYSPSHLSANAFKSPIRFIRCHGIVELARIFYFASLYTTHGLRGWVTWTTSP